MKARAHRGPRVNSEAEQALARYAYKDKEAIQPLARLNAFMAATYPGLPTVPVPVLAPVDASGYLGEFARSGSAPMAQPFLGRAIAKMQFLAKTTGYDAILTVKQELLREHNITDVELAQVHLGGTGLLYEPERQRRGAGPDERGSWSRTMSCGHDTPACVAMLARTRSPTTSSSTECPTSRASRVSTKSGRQPPACCARKPTQSCGPCCSTCA